MRTVGILLFSITIIFSFFIADAAFAGYVKWTAAPDKGSITLGAEGAENMNGRYQLAAAGTLGVSGFSSSEAISDRRYSLIDHSTEIFKVLSVLEKKVADKRLRKKLEDKLPALSDNRLKLAASLSEQISDGGHSAKKDFAFLLLTTLIVFS
jgi:hypothetical protein